MEAEFRQMEQGARKLLAWCQRYPDATLAVAAVVLAVFAVVVWWVAFLVALLGYAAGYLTAERLAKRRGAA